MCGIVGYVGKRNAYDITIEGLKLLEYRGYDSAGIAFIKDNKLNVYKEKGKIEELIQSIGNKKYSSSVAIAHTRWATHGEPSKLNAHPHTDKQGKIAVVHNGIIENFTGLKRMLGKEGYKFITDTDTEVIAHLISKFYKDDLENAVKQAIQYLEGTYGIAVIHENEPGVIVGARNGSPLVVGIGDNEMILASDPNALVSHTDRVIYLDDKETIKLTADSYKTTNLDNITIEKDIEKIDWNIERISKNGYAHFMLKEIFEQPETIMNASRGRLIDDFGTARLGGLNLTREELFDVKKIIITACGTSWHTALLAEYWLEDLARIPVEVEYASEFRYRNPILEKGTIAFVISQSGETADTLAALREAQRKGTKVLGISNVVGSTIARESDGGVYIHAGPEIGVASTKAFTGQLTAFFILTILLGRMRDMSSSLGRDLVKGLKEIPGKIQEILAQSDQIRDITAKYKDVQNALYLGRGYNFPIALEGALKMKEIAYIHAEGYPAAEMKHGPIALIDENMLTVVVAIKDDVYDKVINNIQEIKARNGKIVAIATEGDEEIKNQVDDVIYIPKTEKPLYPMLSVIPLQLMAYHMAVIKECDVDKPRNLAKSVTVE